MRYFVFILMTALLSSSAYADGEMPLVYSKSIIKIIPRPRAPQPAPQKPEKEDASIKPAEILPTLPRVAKEFTVEMRPLQFIQQKDFIVHQPFGDKEGMLIVIDPPSDVPLTSANLLGKVDVLFVADDGLITQIAPDLSLPNLESAIDTGSPIRAFLFLKPGMTKLDDIQPGDHVQGKQFKTPPLMLEDSGDSKAAPQK